MFLHYRPGEGKWCRGGTAVAAWLAAVLPLWKVAGMGQRDARPALFVMSLLLSAAFSYLLVNRPRLADYLIAVEDELRQFEWPRPPALLRGCLLAFAVICLVTIAVVGFDLLAIAVLTAMGA
jgi:preprotein translocase subunit SecE